jgi:hypothetical protein
MQGMRGFLLCQTTTLTRTQGTTKRALQFLAHAQRAEIHLRVLTDVVSPFLLLLRLRRPLFVKVWKKSSHYALWKNFGKPSKKPHANKEEQWKAIREQMMSGNNNANGTNTGGAAAAGAAGAPSTATTAAAQSALAATAAAAGGATLTVKKE